MSENNDSKPVKIYTSGGIDKVVRTIVVGTDKVVTKVVKVPVIVTVPVKPHSISSTPVKTKAETYKRTGATEGESGGTGNQVSIDDLLNKYTFIINALTDIYWKLVLKKNLPPTIPFLAKMKNMINRLKAYKQELLDMEETGIRYLPEYKAKKYESLISDAMNIKDKGFKILYHGEAIDIDTGEESPFMAYLRYITDDYLYKAKRARALLYSIAPYLKRDHFEKIDDMLKEAIDFLEKFEKTLISISKYAELDPASSDFQKAMKYIGIINGVYSIVNRVLEKTSGTDKVVEDDRVKRLILYGDKDAYKEILKKYDEMKKKYQKYLEECRSKYHRPDACVSFETFLKQHGFPYTPETVEILKEYIENYDKILVGETPSPNMAANIRWAISDALDIVLEGPLKLFNAEEISRNLREQAEKETDPTKKTLLRVVADVLPVLKSAGLGAYWGLLSILTLGASDVALAVTGISKLVDELGYYSTDPAYRDEWKQFIEAVKKGDSEALEQLAIMIGSAIAFMGAYKGISSIKIKGTPLKEIIREKLSGKLYSLADKFRAKGWNKLADAVENLADKYNPKKLRLAINATMAGDKEVKMDIRGNKIKITVTENGKIIYQDTIDIPIRNDPIKVFEQFGYDKDTAIRTIKTFLSKTIRSLDDLKQLREYFGLFDDLLEKAKTGKITPNEFKQFINDLLSDKTRATVVFDQKSGFRGLGIRRSDGIIEIFTGTPDKPIVKIKAVADPNNPMRFKSLEFYGADTLDDALRQLGLKDTSDLLRIANKMFGDSITSGTSIQIGDQIIAIAPKEYRTVSLVTEKGYFETTTGNGFIISMGSDKPPLEIPWGKYDSQLFIDPKGNYVMKTTVLMRIRHLGKILKKLGNISDDVKLVIRTAKEFYKNTKDLGKAEKVIDSFIEKLATKIASEEGISKNAVINSLGNLKQVMLTIVKTEGANPSEISIVPLGVVTEQGAALSLSLAIPTSAIQAVESTLTRHDAQELVLEAKQRLGLPEEATVTASQLARALNIPQSLAEAILEKTKEKQGETQAEKTIYLSVTKTDYVTIPKTTPVTIEKELEQQLVTIQEHDIPVIYTGTTDTEYMLVGGKEKHITLTREAIDQLIKTINKEIPVTTQHITDTEYMLIGKSKRSLLLSRERQQLLNQQSSGDVEQVVVPVIKEVTITIPMYKEVLVPWTENPPNKPPPNEVPQPAPPIGLPPIPGAGAGVTLTPRMPRRGKQYETIRL